MLDMLFLLDENVKPCEIVHFELVKTKEESAKNGSTHYFLMRATHSSARFEEGRLYITQSTSFPDRALEIEHGFLGQVVVLVAKKYAEIMIAGENVEADYVENVLQVGVFYPSKEMAEKELLELQKYQ